MHTAITDKISVVFEIGQIDANIKFSILTIANFTQFIITGLYMYIKD